MPARTRVPSLLDEFVADWPRRKNILERSLRRAGIDEEVHLTVKPAVKVRDLTTFKRGVRRSLSPMLRDRFAFASEIVDDGQVWLAADDIAATTRRTQVRRNHAARREYWEDSAPMQFPDEDLSLFAVAPASPEDVVYLVWKPGVTEPELWNYHGMSERTFKDLEAYLTWCLTSRSS